MIKLTAMRKLFFVLLPAFFLMTIISCSEENAQNLIGRWELLSKPFEEVEYYWVFTSSKFNAEATNADENDAPTGELDTCGGADGVGNYVLKNGVLTIAAAEFPCRGTVYVGDWDIEKLDKNFMTLRRESDNGSQWYEFTKVTEE